jgi:competence protein ComEC
VFAKVGFARLPRTVLAATCALGVLTGIALARKWPHGDVRWLLLLVPGIWLLRRQGLAALAVVTVLGLTVGLWRGTAMTRQAAPYQTLALHKVMLVGQASEDAVYGTRSQLVFSMDHVRVVAPLQAALPGSVRVGGFGEAAVFRGDIVQVSGKLYPSRGNTLASVSFAKLRVWQQGNSWIDALRRRFAAGLESALPEPQASFGLGLLIGQRSTLPADVSQTLLAVGLVHIIAVSGYNLTIIINAVRRLLGGRSKFQMAATCLFLMALFVLITGSSPSIVRASMVSTLSLFAWYYGRKIAPLVLLLAAGAASALANPQYVWGNVSWYLSFLAFFGVVVVAPLVLRRLYGEREPKLLVQLVLESLCAEACTLPYVLHIFGQMSLVSLPANVLVAAFVPLAMLLCMAAGVAGVFVPALAGWVAWPARELLGFMLQMADALARVPHSFVQGMAFSASAMVMTYGILLAIVISLHMRAPPVGDNR